MPDQKTEPDVIEKEKSTIMKVANIADINEIVLNDRGWDSRVYSFGNGRYFFKFPRSKKIQSRYKYEISAIKTLSELKTAVYIQNILWEHPENAYFGYEGVRGEPVNTILNKLELAQKQKIGKALGNFLKQLHSLKIEGARNCDLVEESEQIQNWFEKNKVAISDLLSDVEQKRLHNLVYRVWPSRLLDLGIESVLCHGDLHFENILLGHGGEVGIIDFGDIAYFDRSKDFLEISEDEDIFKSVLDIYGNQDELLRQKIDLRKSMIQIINLGFHIGKNDKKNTALTIQRIRRDLN